ncbi:MAG: Cytochrome c biogenesis protein transmembrane region [Parcubacteria group bacterium GW2011_GWC1_38_22]|nr:MAG: Cytochrome c biogenesis protein transmembrane region [Parcubacteria group bacterium GW2011_GWC1_38_22]
MSIFILASLITAFIAGIAALFAPCCISVLLPSYLGSIFREKRKVLIMTFVFFLGIATVFLPIGLGFSALAQFFKEYHNIIFITGGTFLTVLGIMILTKNGFSLPFSVHPQLKKHNAGSVYSLGIFSGIATTCCAPVLAGVLALAVLPGSIIWGGIYTLMYVLGMVAPLFFIALLADKTNVTKKLMNMRKTFSYNFLGKKITITFAELMSGALFLIMGIVTVYYAFMGNLTVHAEYQITINIYFDKLLKMITAFITPIALYVWIGISLFITYMIVKIIKILSQKNAPNSMNEDISKDKSKNNER